MNEEGELDGESDADDQDVGDDIDEVMGLLGNSMSFTSGLGGESSGDSHGGSPMDES